MIVHLSIRNLLLIRALDIEARAGLTALSGETGAGKSIILTGLSLALGLRAGRGLVRNGAERSIVAARFEVSPTHKAWQILADAGVEADPESGLCLRRVIGADERSRAYVNDIPVSAGLLRLIGESLCRIHSQFDALRLFDTACCRAMLDEFADLGERRLQCAQVFAIWKDAEFGLTEARLRQAGIVREREYLETALSELDGLAPLPDEEKNLVSERLFFLSLNRVSEALAEAQARFSDRNGPLPQCSAIARALERAARGPGFENHDAMSGRISLVNSLEQGTSAIERAMLEIEEASAQVSACLDQTRVDSSALERLENRLFALRAIVRKFGNAGEEAHAIHERIRSSLASIVRNDETLARFEVSARESEASYRDLAMELRAARLAAAPELARAVMRDLAQMQLGAAQFGVELMPREWSEAGPDGADLCEFMLVANPGEPGGVLRETASGGELSRVALALTATLATRTPMGNPVHKDLPTLVFDEADQGLGGAQAAAIGAMLSRLAGARQVLAITHSPQVAACADHHWKATKQVAGTVTFSEVETLSGRERCEEIARMLSGEHLSPEAWRAAERLLAESGGRDQQKRPRRTGVPNDLIHEFRDPSHHVGSSSPDRGLMDESLSVFVALPTESFPRSAACRTHGNADSGAQA